MRDANVKALTPMLNTGRAAGRANLRPPWKPGQSGNPRGRPSHRRLFEEALARAVTERADEIVAALVTRALEGDARMMTALLDRLLPRVTRHEIEADAAPNRIVLAFQKPGDAGAEVAARELGERETVPPDGHAMASPPAATRQPPGASA